jgi:hypothetical protein
LTEKWSELEREQILVVQVVSASMEHLDGVINTANPCEYRGHGQISLPSVPGCYRSLDRFGRFIFFTRKQLHFSELRIQR